MFGLHGCIIIAVVLRLPLCVFTIETTLHCKHATLWKLLSLLFQFHIDMSDLSIGRRISLEECVLAMISIEKRKQR